MFTVFRIPDYLIPVRGYRQSVISFAEIATHCLVACKVQVVGDMHTANVSFLIHLLHKTFAATLRFGFRFSAKLPPTMMLDLGGLLDYPSVPRVHPSSA